MGFSIHTIQTDNGREFINHGAYELMRTNIVIDIKDKYIISGNNIFDNSLLLIDLCFILERYILVC